MKELLEIIATAKSAAAPMALATVVQTAGSTYRRAGARMLILDNGRNIGCISGGCLDHEVIQRGLEVMATGKAALMTYDSSSPGDIVFGAGSGCPGVIEILLTQVPPRNQPRFLDAIGSLMERRQSASAATVVKPLQGLVPGDWLILDDTGAIATNLAGPIASSFLVQQTRRRTSPDVFVEAMAPPVNLVIFGAGQDAMPLARMAHELGQRVSIVDSRPGYATWLRFPHAAEILAARPEDNSFAPVFDARTVAVIMTHHFLTDQAWLKRLLPLRLPYLGLMGPRKRALKLFEELRQDGFEPRAEDLAALHNPIGLDLGAAAPEQIALAILAEIQAALAGRDGGKLCQKNGAIRLPAPAAEFAGSTASRAMDNRLCGVLV